MAKDKVKKLKKYSPMWLMKTLIYSGSMAFVISSVFDILVTYANYLKYGAEVFNYMELNLLLVWGNNAGIPFFLNPGIITNFLLIIPAIYSYKLYEKKQTKFRTRFILTMLFFICFGIVGHALGGYSWLRV